MGWDGWDRRVGYYWLLQLLLLSATEAGPGEGNYRGGLLGIFAGDTGEGGII